MLNATAGLLAILAAALPERPGHPVRPVTRAEMIEAMERSQGYDPTATTNGARFQAEVLLLVARRARESHPEGPPLFLDHEDWFQALLARTGLPADQAPLFARLARENGQDIEVEYRPERVIARVESGPEPRFAANVTIGWPRAPGGPSRYSYDDLLSTPRLRVTNERVLSYRLLDFGDVIVYADIQGLTGRPTTGLLGFLFRLMGEGHVEENRMAIAPDGLQISRARASKAFFSVTATVTVSPDGRTEKDLPAGRPDLAEIEARLKRPLGIAFAPAPRDWPP
jgi:hypothetical protein